MSATHVAAALAIGNATAENESCKKGVAAKPEKNSARKKTVTGK